MGKNESPAVKPEPALSQADVLLILSHMIKSNHVDIRHIQMPKHWQINENNSGLKQFFALYSKRLSTHCDCSNCDERIIRGGKRKKLILENGLQKFTCYQCMDCICAQCVKEDYSKCDVNMVGTCEKLLCFECGLVMTCFKCVRRRVTIASQCVFVITVTKFCVTNAASLIIFKVKVARKRHAWIVPMKLRMFGGAKRVMVWHLLPRLPYQ